MARDEQVNQAFMLWLAENNANRPNPDEILNLGAIDPGGVAITSDELEAGTEYLEAVGLIKGHKSWNRPMPLRVSITPDGLRCVREFNGDVSAWNASQRPSYTDQSVNVSAGRDAQVVGHSQNVNQAQNASAVNVEGLVEAAAGARALLPSLAGVDGVDHREVEAVAAEIEIEGKATVPDQAKLRRLGTRLKDLLGPAAAGLALAKFTVAVITAALPELSRSPGPT